LGIASKQYSVRHSSVPDRAVANDSKKLYAPPFLDAVTKYGGATDEFGDLPMVNVRLIEGVFTPTQKQEMIRKLTDTMVSIENMRELTLVVIDEVKSGDWGLGGKPLTSNAVKELAAGKAKG
jgi:4-oxalocrotonate tautomerase